MAAGNRAECNRILCHARGRRITTGRGRRTGTAGRSGGSPPRRMGGIDARAVADGPRDARGAAGNRWAAADHGGFLQDRGRSGAGPGFHPRGELPGPGWDCVGCRPGSSAGRAWPRRRRRRVGSPSCCRIIRGLAAVRSGTPSGWIPSPVWHAIVEDLRAAGYDCGSRTDLEALAQRLCHAEPAPILDLPSLSPAFCRPAIGDRGECHRGMGRARRGGRRIQAAACDPGAAGGCGAAGSWQRAGSQGELPRSRSAAMPRLRGVLSVAAACAGGGRAGPSGHPWHAGMAARQVGGTIRRLHAGCIGRRAAGDIPVHRQQSGRGCRRQAPARRGDDRPPDTAAEGGRHARRGRRTGAADR